MAEGEARFLLWNDALVRHFFQPEMSGKAVYLYVTRETLGAVGDREGLDPEGFVDAVRGGPPWATRQGLCQRALQACNGWRVRDLEFPPYVNFLALFVLAAGVEGDFAPHAYYPRLRELLGEEEGGMLPSFDRMLDLWDDLERWSTQDQDGKLGLFEANIVGGWIHVGLPLAQTILAEEERRSLPQIFGSAGFDSASVPPDDEVVRGLRDHGRRHLKPRTVRLLEGSGDQGRLTALMDVVVEELAQWDGRVESDTLGEPPAAFGALRLCAIWDPVSQRIRTSLRCRIGGEFPEGILILSGPDLLGAATCEEAVAGWSTELAAAGKPEALDGRRVGWSRGTVLSDATGKWRFALRASAVRVLVRGIDQGVPGFIEVTQLPRQGPFSLLFQTRIADEVREWGQTECKNFEEQSIATGLPEGWVMARADGLLSGGNLPASLAVVAPSPRVRLMFAGGLRSGPGNSYFSFAAPAIRIEGGAGDECVWCHDIKLAEKEGLYEIPPGLPAERRIVVEVRRSSEPVRRRSLYLTGDFAWTIRRAEIEFDRWGRRVSEVGATPTVCGARVEGAVETASYRVHAMQVVAEANAWRRRMFLVGQRTGAITRWPQEPYPLGWVPVWAIPMESRGRALFCGSDPSRCAPIGGECINKRGRRWKEVLWSWRHRIEPPTHPVLRKLWNDYREASRRA